MTPQPANVPADREATERGVLLTRSRTRTPAPSSPPIKTQFHSSGYTRLGWNCFAWPAARSFSHLQGTNEMVIVCEINGRFSRSRRLSAAFRLPADLIKAVRKEGLGAGRRSAPPRRCSTAQTTVHVPPAVLRREAALGPSPVVQRVVVVIPHSVPGLPARRVRDSARHLKARRRSARSAISRGLECLPE